MTRAMQVIPVLDLRAGIVVHARRDQRSEYVPLRSSLVPGCEPVAVARALCTICRTRTVYVADLDALGGNPVDEATLAGLASVAATWVDAGATTSQRAAALARAGVARNVVGTESIDGHCPGACPPGRSRRCLSSLYPSRTARDRPGPCGHRLWPTAGRRGGSRSGPPRSRDLRRRRRARPVRPARARVGRSRRRAGGHCFARRPPYSVTGALALACSGARRERRARWRRARPRRRLDLAGSTLNPSRSHLTDQEAADCDCSQRRDRNRIDKCGLAQAVVRCRDASEHGRNASCQVADEIDRSD